jgi:flavin reductase
MEKATSQVDRDSFRAVMALQASAVTILTTDGPAGPYGLTATAVCSVTDSPPTLLVCVNRSSRTHAGFHENGVVCVNILAGSQEALAGHFGKSGLSVEERFAEGHWMRGATGAPMLAGAMANIDCVVTSITEAGTHSIFLCEIRGITTAAEGDALVYWNRRFHQLKLAELAA